MREISPAEREYEERVSSCLNACATLKDPVEDIRDLVLAIRAVNDMIVYDEEDDERDPREIHLDNVLERFRYIK